MRHRSRMRRCYAANVTIAPDTIAREKPMDDRSSYPVARETLTPERFPPAVEEFLAEHTEWELRERFRNNNGLTVLARK